MAGASCASAKGADNEDERVLARDRAAEDAGERGDVWRELNGGRLIRRVVGWEWIFEEEAAKVVTMPVAGARALKKWTRGSKQMRRQCCCCSAAARLPGSVAVVGVDDGWMEASQKCRWSSLPGAIKACT